MRILFITKEKEENFKSLIKYSENTCLAKVDFMNDFEEAEYCIDIRTYDFIFAHYYQDMKKSYLNIFKIARTKEFQPKIIMFDHMNELDLQTKEYFKSYNVDNYIESTIKDSLKDCISELELFLNNKTKDIILTDNIQIDLAEKTIYYKEKDKEAIQIIFKKKIDFYVFLYFIRHYKETININALLDATCKEPELTKDSIIEASISSIRNTFKAMIGINPIRAFKKVGYNFSL